MAVINIESYSPAQMRVLERIVRVLRESNDLPPGRSMEEILRSIQAQYADYK